MTNDEEQVRHAIEAIALNPSMVGLTHAKILRDEIGRLRSRLARANRTRLLLVGVAPTLRLVADALDALTGEPA